jgi:hypothetical protein
LSLLGTKPFGTPRTCFSLKIALHLLALDVIDNGIFTPVSGRSGGKYWQRSVSCCRGRGVQEDLIATYYLLANGKYCKTVRLKRNPRRAEMEIPRGQYGASTACFR